MLSSIPWRRLACSPLGLGAFFLFVLPCAGQSPSPREELLRLVPADTGLCLIVSDLRGRCGKMREAAWFKAVRASPLIEALADSPEMRRLARFETDLQKHLQIDWAQLRDDILGDQVVLAYRPAPPDQPQKEQGLLLLWARNSDLLARVIDRLNEAQKKVNELKELTAIDYPAGKYYRRVENDTTHYYFLDGSLLAFSSQESTIRKVIDQHRQKSSSSSSLVQQIRRAGAHRSLATVWLNPRAFDADLQQKVRQGVGAEVPVLQTFLTYWQVLDAIVLAVELDENPQVRLSLQARAQELPKSLRRLFTEKAVPSELWSRFPANSMVRLAGRLDAVALSETLGDFTPPPARQAIVDAVQRNLGAALGLDLAKDVLPNLGPDWGLCIAPGQDKDDFPWVIAALAVRPGSKDLAVDQALWKGVQMLAGLGALGYNSTHSEPVYLKTLMQDKVEVKYFTSDKVFPAGVQPALALKDGFFLLASSPEAIRRFQQFTQPAFPPGENPLLHLSLSELSKFLKSRRQKLTAFLAGKNQISQAVAGQWLDGLVAGLGIFDHILVTERREAGQVTWSLRLQSALKK